MRPESALIIPVPEAEPLVRDLRDRFDLVGPEGVPAHITVVYPFLDPDVLTTSITRDLEAMIAGVPVFRFELNAIAPIPRRGVPGSRTCKAFHLFDCRRGHPVARGAALRRQLQRCHSPFDRRAHERS